MPSCELNKEIKMASETESCTAESKAKSDDEVYVEAEKTDSGVHLVPKWKTKVLCGNILVSKLIETAVLFVLIYQSVARARTTQQLQHKIQMHQTCAAT